MNAPKQKINRAVRNLPGICDMLRSSAGSIRIWRGGFAVQRGSCVPYSIGCRGKPAEEFSTQRARAHGNSGLGYFFLAGFFFADVFGLSFLVGLSGKTRAKILSTFFSWRGRSKACSMVLRGTRSVISLSARTRSWKLSPSFHARMA